MLDRRRLEWLEMLGIDVYVRRDMASSAESAPVTLAPASPGARTRAAGPMPDTPVLAEHDRPAQDLDWESLRATVAVCRRCHLHATRTQTVFGVGDPEARWMFIGEAPGAEEDRQGEPFVGRAGQLLTAMIRALGFDREQVYIANVLKCRPPGNRDPKPEEAKSCRSYLDRQIDLVSPTLVVAVGRVAAQTLLGTDTPLARLRGRVHSLAGRWPMVVIYHPAYLLRSPLEKRKAWQDLLFARDVFGRLARGEAVLP